MAAKAESWSKVNSFTVFVESTIAAPGDIPSKQEVTPILTHRTGKRPPAFLVTPRFGKKLSRAGRVT
jgi:hypothetical protein